MEAFVTGWGRVNWLSAMGGKQTLGSWSDELRAVKMLFNKCCQLPPVCCSRLAEEPQVSPQKKPNQNKTSSFPWQACSCAKQAADMLPARVFSVGCCCPSGWLAATQEMQIALQSVLPPLQSQPPSYLSGKYIENILGSHCRNHLVS